MLVNIMPERFDALVAVGSGRSRVTIGRLLNPVFAQYWEAADRALARVLREGAFVLVDAHRHRYRFRFRAANPAQFRQAIDLLGNTRPRLSPGTWPWLKLFWTSRPADPLIEIAFRSSWLESLVLPNW